MKMAKKKTPFTHLVQLFQLIKCVFIFPMNIMYVYFLHDREQLR